ncbi:hypothetical protein L596_018370 [Steinernema carpocapsae]|uniref:Uncharacterized protein n=1 Tax=Steinernema carpocapsae TaxID=34508 RepID=A0A4V6A203_STECR|nr:hypothetical protein L596_018370 [Steinernema carpocapsae]
MATSGERKAAVQLQSVEKEKSSGVREACKATRPPSRDGGSDQSCIRSDSEDSNQKIDPNSKIESDSKSKKSVLRTACT